MEVQNYTPTFFGVVHKKMLL